MEDEEENSSDSEEEEKQMGTFDAGAKTQEQNKAVFRKNYGLEL